jgi:hypothetical protein
VCPAAVGVKRPALPELIITPPSLRTTVAAVYLPLPLLAGDPPSWAGLPAARDQCAGLPRHITLIRIIKRGCLVTTQIHTQRLAAMCT